MSKAHLNVVYLAAAVSDFYLPLNDMVYFIKND